MDERISRVLEKMKEKGIDQLLVSDPLSIRFLTGIMVNPGTRHGLHVSSFHFRSAALR